MPMNWMSWILLGLLVLFALLFAIGLRFPIPRRHWPFNRKNTVILVISTLVFVTALILLNVLRHLLGWPRFETDTVFYFSLVCFGILVLLGTFLPKGIRPRRG